MNKKVIAIGAASATLAALPVVGAFAATTSQQDIVTVTINESCTMEATTGGSSQGTGTLTIEGSTMSITCNDAAGWTLNAQGTGGEGTDTSMVGSEKAAGKSIVTGTTLSGDTSEWAMKLTGTGVESGFDANHEIPGTATKVASGTEPTAANQIKAEYTVFVAPSQQTGTYTGKVTYTLVGNDAGGA